MSFAEASAASTQIRINGTKYTFAPLTFGDWGKLEQFVRGKILELGRLQAEQTKDDKVRQTVIESAWAQAMKFSVSEPGALVSSPDALVYLFWLSIGKFHKDIDFDKASEIIELCDDYPQVIDTIMRLSGQTRTKEDEDQKKTGSANQ